EERAEISRRLESAIQQIWVVTADTARVQAQAVQLGQTMTTILDRQKEVEDAAHHIAMRLERVIEVNQDMEARLRQEFTNYQDDRFEVVFELLQVVGEMVRRSEDMILAVAAERSMREVVLEEVSLWLDQQARFETRITAL